MPDERPRCFDRSQWNVAVDVRKRLEPCFAVLEHDVGGQLGGIDHQQHASSNGCSPPARGSAPRTRQPVPRSHANTLPNVRDARRRATAAARARSDSATMVVDIEQAFLGLHEDEVRFGDVQLDGMQETDGRHLSTNSILYPAGTRLDQSNPPPPRNSGASSPIPETTVAAPQTRAPRTTAEIAAR